MLRAPNYSFLQMRKLSLRLNDFLKVPRQVCEKTWEIVQNSSESEGLWESPFDDHKTYHLLHLGRTSYSWKHKLSQLEGAFTDIQSFLLPWQMQQRKAHRENGIFLEPEGSESKSPIPCLGVVKLPAEGIDILCRWEHQSQGRIHLFQGATTEEQNWA